MSPGPLLCLIAKPPKAIPIVFFSGDPMSIERLPPQFPQEPGAGQLPVPHDCFGGDADNFSRLLHVKSRKEAQFNDAGLSRVDFSQGVQRFVERDVFLTPRLWGVGSTAPYGHRGDFRMLDEIIAAHGGEARFARDAYLALDKSERDSVIAFLRSLVIETPR